MLSVFLAFLYYKNYYSIKVAAPDLAHAYSKNIQAADKEYLDKEVEVKGQVKKYHNPLNSRAAMQLRTYRGDIPLFCLFLNKEDNYTASKLKENQSITIKGKCVGISKYNSIICIQIEVNEITTM